MKNGNLNKFQLPHPDEQDVNVIYSPQSVYLFRRQFLYLRPYHQSFQRISSMSE